MQTASDWTYLSRRYGLAALLALTFVIFAGALNYAPLENLDDWAYVTENPNLGFSAAQLKALVTEPVLDLYTPLPMLTYLADYACGGVSPFAYHLQNLLWHLCAVWLAWLLLRELGLRRESALLAALIFAVHPQRVESVVWISERKDVMCTVFVLMSLVLHLQARRHGARFSIASAVTMVLALLCKPIAVAIPGILFLLEIRHLRRFDWKAALRSVILPVALAVLYLIASTALLGRVSRQAAEGGVDLLLVGRNLLAYFVKTFVPWGVMPIHPDFVATDLAVMAIFLGLALAGTAAALGRKYRRDLVDFDILPLLGAGFLPLLPVLGFVPFSNADFADRYSYLPSVFFLGALFLCFDRLRFRRFRWYRPAVLIAAGLLAVHTLSILPVWRDDRALLERCCSVPEANFRAAVAWAGRLLEEERPAEAAEALRTAGKASRRAQAQLNTEAMKLYAAFLEAVTRFQAGDPQAEAALRAVAESPDRPLLRQLYYRSGIMLWTALAQCQLAGGRPAEAAASFRALAADYADDRFLPHFYRGVAAMLERDPKTAQAEFLEALVVRPDDQQTMLNYQAAAERAAAAEK